METPTLPSNWSFAISSESESQLSSSDQVLIFKMSVVPPLSGSGLAFASTVLTNVFIYIKHRRRRVIDLLDDFEKLKDEVNDLLASWTDINDKIERQFASEKNTRYTTMEKKVSMNEEEFKKIEGLYRKLCTDLEFRVGAASGLNEGTDENKAGIGKQKIWTRNFFKLGRLDKEVVKLKDEVTGLRKEVLELGVEGFTRPKNPKIVEILQVEELGDIVPSHQKHLKDLLKYVKQKYLLILDNFSPLVKLEDVGIRKEHEDGKVVMAAKSSHALRNVQLDKKIEVTRLSLSDTHKFFKHCIKDYDGLHREQKTMVKQILPHLGGLPVFIKLTAQYLNDHRQLLQWKGIKDGLESDVGILQLQGMAPVIASYMKVYEDLEQNYLKKCLLYMALFPSMYKICIRTLVECWKAENLLDCRHETLNNARAAATLVFSRLMSSCLIESCGERHVRMSVFFRKVALDIPFPDEGDGALCVRSSSDKDGHLEETTWNNARRLSLWRSE